MPPPTSEQTQVCILCHRNYTPGIVEDWLKSRHSKITPQMALKKPPLERRISSEVIPETLQSTVVGCYECHSLNASAHKDNFEHFGFWINVIVSPNDCKTCHSVEVDQYSVSKKATHWKIFNKTLFIIPLVRQSQALKKLKTVK